MAANGADHDERTTGINNGRCDGDITMAVTRSHTPVTYVKKITIWLSRSGSDKMRKCAAEEGYHEHMRKGIESLATDLCYELYI